MTPNEALQAAKDALEKAIQQKNQNQELLRSLGPAIIDALKPVLQEVSANSKVTKEELVKALSSMQINVPKADVPQAQVEVKIPDIKVPAPQVSVNVPDIKIPEIKIPVIKVPKPEVTVNVPPIKIPPLQWPTGEMSIGGWVKLMGYDTSFLNNPLPVQLRDANGNPVSLGGNSVAIGGGGGGIVTIGGATVTVGVVTINPDGRPTYSTGSAGGATSSVYLTNGDDLYYNSDNPLPVTGTFSSSPAPQVSGAVDSVNVVQFASNLAVAGGGYQDNAVRVVHATDAVVSVNITNTDLDIRDLTNATDLVSAYQVSGHTWSVSVNDIFRTTAASSLINADDRLRVSLETGGSGLTDAELRATAVPVSQVSGANWSTEVTNLFQAVADSGGGEGVANALRVVQASDSVVSTKITATDVSLDVKQVSGSVDSVSVTNTVTVTVSGSLTSTVATGPTVGDAVDDGSAPIQVGGIARTANPTAVAGGDVVKASFDDLGRQLVRHQARDLVLSAYVSLTNGTETTLAAGVASTFLDLIWITGANTSDAAVQVDIRSGTAGSTLLTLEIPAYGTAGAVFGADHLQQEIVAGAWTADMPDITGTTVYLSAKFSKEV
jgi:hypothetical protein